MTLEEAIKDIRQNMKILNYYEQGELNCLSIILDAAEKWDELQKQMEFDMEQRINEYEPLTGPPYMGMQPCPLCGWCDGKHEPTTTSNTTQEGK